MKLVIVESPTKCKTVQHYLGDGYKVMASKGHIRELSTSGENGFGLDSKNKFKPIYKIDKTKTKLVKELLAEKKLAEEVILATDPDREGEAIAWHLAEVLGLDIKTTKRLEFHEITKQSIADAIKNPRTIDMNLVSAQETRRVLDRVIGFKLSTLLYKKIKSKSAGRVQSAALDIIYQNELDIKNFIPEEYWKLHIDGLYKDVTYALNYKEKITNATDAKAIIDAISNNAVVKDIEKEIKESLPPVPFKTSTLQQSAFNKYKFSTKMTSKLAQELYEGLNVNGEQVGLITYIRTDATRLAPIFISSAFEYIEKTFGKEMKGKVRQGKDKGQDAHEAIRPTSIERTPDSIKQYLSEGQYKLYKLIYDRTLASLLAPAIEEVTTVTLDSNGVSLELKGYKNNFLGFKKIYKPDGEDKITLPEINKGDIFEIVKKEGEQKFTEPPLRFTEAKLVKAMEECGIGRPSTYSTTISTICDRDYVKKEKGNLIITDQGFKTSLVLRKYFHSIINTTYTSEMEEKLDTVASGDTTYYDFIVSFFDEFFKLFEESSKKMYADEVTKLDEICPKCGSPLVIRVGRNGSFIACSNYPECDYIKKPEIEYADGVCPKCGARLVVRTSKKGKKFIGCSAYPKCDYIQIDEKVKERKEKALRAKEEIKPEDYIKDCPDCGGHLIKKKGKYGYFLGCTNFPKCKHMEKYHSDKKNDK